MNNLLPIGTVVLLKEATHKIMIMGRIQISDGKAYQYSGVLFPEGYMGSKNIFLFNESDIAETFYEGFHNEEEENFTNLLMQKIQEQTEKEK